MSLSDSLKNKKFDIRMLDWNLKNGVISQEQYKQYVAELSDNTDRCEHLNFEDSEPAADEPANPQPQTNGASSMHGFHH